ncbi:MAG: hypothetical protein IJ708_10255 [Clostridia bacterium]|nr:hypothetical protein [Clostridia bacterium]
MSKAFEDTRNEGAMRKAVAIARKLIQAGKLTLNEIANVTELSMDTIRELAGQQTA